MRTRFFILGCVAIVCMLLSWQAASQSNISQPLPVQDQATGSTGSSVPSKAVAIGGIGSGNLTGLVVCDSSAVINATASGFTEIVAASSGKSVYVCGFSMMSNGTANVKLATGTKTSTACDTSEADRTGAYPLIAQTGLSQGSGVGYLFKSTSGGEVCVNLNATATVAGLLTYSQF